MADPQVTSRQDAGLPAAEADDVLAQICGQIAGAFRRQWGRGPAKTRAHWAGPNILLVLLENGHTEAEKTMRAAGHIQQLLDGRQLLQTTLEEELEAIVEAATGRTVLTMLSATRLDPDLSAEVFLLGEAGPAGPEHELNRAVHDATNRAHAFGDEAEAVQAQARHVRTRVHTRRAKDK